MQIPHDKYVLHAQFVARRIGEHDKSVRHEYAGIDFGSVHNDWKQLVNNGWHAGIFYYDKQGRQSLFRASEHYNLLRDVPPLVPQIKYEG